MPTCVPALGTAALCHSAYHCAKCQGRIFAGYIVSTVRRSPHRPPGRRWCQCRSRCRGLRLFQNLDTNVDTFVADVSFSWRRNEFSDLVLILSTKFAVALFSEVARISEAEAESRSQFAALPCAPSSTPSWVSRPSDSKQRSPACTFWVSVQKASTD